jgi:hypothetical protein
LSPLLWLAQWGHWEDLRMSLPLHLWKMQHGHKIFKYFRQHFFFFFFYYSYVHSRLGSFLPPSPPLPLTPPPPSLPHPLNTQQKLFCPYF